MVLNDDVTPVAFSQLMEHVAKLERELEAVSDRMNARWGEMQNSFGNLVKSVENQIGTLSGYIKRLLDQVEPLTPIPGRVQALEKKNAQILTGLQKLNGEIVRVEKKSEELVEKIAEGMEERLALVIDILGQRMCKLEARSEEFSQSTSRVGKGEQCKSDLEHDLNLGNDQEQFLPPTQSYSEQNEFFEEEPRLLDARETRKQFPRVQFGGGVWTTRRAVRAVGGVESSKDCPGSANTFLFQW